MANVLSAIVSVYGRRAASRARRVIVYSLSQAPGRGKPIFAVTDRRR
jgi:hypothetical protein